MVSSLYAFLSNGPLKNAFHKLSTRTLHFQGRTSRVTIITCKIYFIWAPMTEQCNRKFDLIVDEKLNVIKKVVPP